MPTLNYISTSGFGDRNVQRLRAIREFGHVFVCNNRIRSYTVRELKKNFIMGPFEMEWGEETEEGTHFIMNLWVPDYVTETYLKLAMKDRLGRDDLPITIQTIPGGLCAQTLHIGSYQEIYRVLVEMESAIKEKGYKPIGRHNEIYLNHTNIGWPENLKIIIRQRIEEFEI